jgi:hypothetical protein
MVLPDSASIVKDIIPNLLGDRDILGRFVIYQGKDKVLTANGMELYCTNNWDVPFERFQRLIEEHREHPYEEDRE